MINRNSNDDEYVKNKVRDTYNKLKQSKVDFKSDSYRNSEEFLKIKDKKIKLYENIVVTQGNIIYKYYVPNEVKETIHGVYSLGYTGPADPTAYTIEGLCNFIMQHKLPASDSDINLELYFERNKSGHNSDGKNGIIKRLFDWGIDIDKYDDISKFKLLYYLFNIEKIIFNENRKKELEKEKNNGSSDIENIKTKDGDKKEDRINIFKMLNNPTLENVDNSNSGDITRNGEIMFRMKNDLFLEIPLKTMHNYNHTIIHIIYRIECIIFASNDFLIESDNLKPLIDKISLLPPYDEYINYSQNITDKKSNLFCDVYLKLLQHENLGRINDILSISVDDVLKMLPVGQRFYKMDMGKVILKAEAHNYLKSNRASLAKIVFESDSVDSNDLKRYDNAVENIDNLIDILSRNTRLCDSELIREALLVVILQCYIFINKTKGIKNPFFHYKTSDKKTLRNEMNLGTDALDKNQLAIATLIYDTYYAKCGKKEIRNIVNQFHTYADNIIKMLMSCTSIEQMVYIYSASWPYLKGFIYKDDIIDYIIQEANKLLKKGYTIRIDTTIKSMLVALIIDRDVFNGFINFINYAICALKCSEHISIRIIDDLLDITRMYEVEIEICSKTKKVNINRVYLKKVDFGKSFS